MPVADANLTGGGGLPRASQAPFPRHGRRIFLADLHLDGTPSPRAKAFYALLNRLALEAAHGPTELYLLGDLFEFWAESHREVPALYEQDLRVLEAAKDAGVTLTLLSGNRDFAYGRYVERRLGARLLRDGGTVTLSDARKLWIEHGDLLCLKDRRYLRYRRWVRSWPVRLCFWLLPWFMARRLIAGVSAKARVEKSAKDPAILELSLEAARDRLERNGCQVLLCGHTHRPQATDLGAGLRLLVLPAWCELPAGYQEHGGALTPVWFDEAGRDHPASHTGERLPELPERMRRFF